MKKLTLELYIDNKISFNKKLDYFLKDNVINFKDNNILYKYDLNNDIFIKKDNEYENIFFFKEKRININIIDSKHSFDYPLENVTINKDNNIIKIEYDTEEHHLIIINY